MKLKTLLFILFITVAAAGLAQSVSASMRKARAAVDKGDYEVGALEYAKVLKADSNHLDANLEYGLLMFEFLNNASKGGYYIKKAEKECKRDTALEILFGLAKYYHQTGSFTDAIHYYQRVVPHIDDQNPDGRRLISELQRSIASCRFAMEGADISRSRIRVRNAGAGINTLYPEYVPVLTPDGQTIIFTSRRKISSNSTINDEEGGFYEDMFMASRGADGKFANPQAFSLHSSKIPGQSDRHESVVSLSFVNNKLYTFFDGRLYEAQRQGDKWGAPLLVEDSISAKDEFRNHICITADGNTLYFSADHKGGMGGLDIYRSVRQSNGKWGSPENLGSSVNTPEDDNSPQLSPDGNTLYFASKGHPGYGGYDLYKTAFRGGSWSQAENLGRPFNSPADDIYLLVTDEKQMRGYFASARPGGYGDMDIYEIGYVMPFEDFSVDPQGRIAVSVPDTVYVGDTVKLAATAAAGAGEVGAWYWQVGDSVLAGPSNPYAYRFRKTGTVMVRTHAELADADKTLIGAEKQVVVAERKAPVVASAGTGTVAAGAPAVPETVYFELNKAELSAEGAAALERTVAALKAAPDRKIEIAGYSDTRGAAAYNKALSARRAQAVLQYLRKSGIAARQVKKTAGYGEESILNRCTEGVECSESEHGVNRRVELKWVEK
jgi:outer membrane protein OmpA-like peptidoglycan-associated protein/tetratricopeptide (TPR) repeat protein